MAFDDPTGIDRLDAYLDAIARGQRPAPGDLDPALIDTDRRFRRLADAPPPNRSFVTHLREDLMHAATHPEPAIFDLNLTAPTSIGTAAPPWRAPRRLPPHARKRHSRWALAQLATAALLVLTFGSFFLAFGRHAVFTPQGQSTAMPAATPANDAPMFGGNLARTGELIGPGPVGAPGIRWRTRLTEGGGEPANGPAVVGDLAYVVAGRGGGLQAIDTASGAERWRAALDGSNLGFPAVAAGVVYVAAGTQGTLHAFDATTGTPLWQFATDLRLDFASPAVADGVVYVVSGTGSAPAVVDGAVYVGGGATTAASTDPSVLVALDAATGTERWRLTLDGTGYFAVDTATGTQRWFFATDELDAGFTPAVAAGVVYAGDRGFKLYAIDAATGTERWRFLADDAVYGVAVADGTVYASVGGPAGQPYLYAVDAATGEQRWRFAAGDRVRSSPAVVDDTVYVGSDDGHLYAVDAATGAERWRVEVGGWVRGFPVVVDGVVYLTHGISQSGGELIAIGDLPADTPTTGVPMFGSNLARTGVQAGPGPVGTPRILWTVTMAEGFDVAAHGPAVVDGVAYAVASNSSETSPWEGLRAFDTASGAERWRADISGTDIGFPTVADGVVYIASGTYGVGQGALQAFDAATGNQRWRFDAPYELGMSYPAVAGGLVYVASGAMLTPAVVDGTVYVGGGETTEESSEPSILFAIDAATGTERWQLTLEETGYFAVDAATGTQRWFFETSQFGSRTAPAVADGVVYVGDRNGALYAIDAASGAERWVFTAADSVYGIAVADGVVYAGVGGSAGLTEVHAVDAATGEERWRFTTGGRVRSSPAVVDGVVYVGSDDGNLYAIDAATGADRWRVEVGGWVRGFPVVVDGVIYVTQGTSETSSSLFAIGDLPAGATPVAATPTS